MLVVGDVPDGDAFAEKLMEDIGAGTLVQLAAPGAYSEALQGLLQLTDAAGQVHPDLLPTPPAQMPPLALVDLAGKVLQVEGTNGATGAVEGATGGATNGATRTTDGATGGTGGLPLPTP